jgi:hypothetical protein
VASFLLDRSNKVTEAFSSTSVAKFTSVFREHETHGIEQDGESEDLQQTRTSDTRIIKPKRPAGESTEGRAERRQTPCLNSTDETSCVPNQSNTAKVRPRDYKIVHVFVALCDNRHQGIVRVPKELGNGQNPRTNLYWGALYGVRTFFRRSSHWHETTFTGKPCSDAVLKRCVFRSSESSSPIYVIADAYDGSRMRSALTDFFRTAAGLDTAEIAVSGTGRSVQAMGKPDMVCFVGHNGLMDLSLSAYPKNSGRTNPDCAVVLACRSSSYFEKPLRKAGCTPLITTSGLMAPEAYTLDAVIRSWAAGDSPAETMRKAAEAYAKYQKISNNAAVRLFVTSGPRSM